MSLDVETRDYSGKPVMTLRTPTLREGGLIVFDLNFEAVDPLKLIATLKSSAETKSVSLLGYLSHLQSELKVQAQDAGALTFSVRA